MQGGRAETVVPQSSPSRQCRGADLCSRRQSKPSSHRKNCSACLHHPDEHCKRRFIGTVMNVFTDFSDMHGGGDTFIAIFVHLQWNFHKQITQLQRVPDLLLTVMKSADGNTVLLTPGAHAHLTAARLLDQP